MMTDEEKQAPTLSVWYGSMPESNGRKNWTASLHRKGGDVHMDGFCFARSEYPDRVRYEADRVRWIIGEISEKPDILAYDADLHSGYVHPNDKKQGRHLDSNGDLIGSSFEMTLRSEYRKVAKHHDLGMNGVAEADMVRSFLLALETKA